MAFPGLGKSSLSYVWSSVKSTAGRIKDVGGQLTAATSVTRKSALDYQNFLADSLAALNTWSATPGLLAYAQNEENNPTLDLVAEYTAMKNSIVALQDWLVTNFPKDASGNLAVYSFDVNKRFADINLTAGQLTAYKSQVNTLVATIN